MVAQLLALLLALSPVAPAQERESLEAFLIERMRANEAPGMSYALVRRDELVASGAWGTDGNGRPMTPRTPVGFGSVAKPITAVGILRLVGTGTVGLDDPVVEHLPWFRLADQDHARRITVRHLVEQTSGLPPSEGYARSDLDDNAPGALRRWVESLADVTPNAAPGERHQYNPANANILGAMAEEVTGLSFADFMAREVFGPLDMTDAIADAATAAESLPPGHEYYLGGVRTAPARFDTSGVPYGYSAGSVTDLAHLAMPLIGDGRFDGRQVLSPDLVRDIPHSGPTAAGGHYGLGWRTHTLDPVGTTIVWHAGAVPGYHTALITAPDEGWAIAVQQNVWSPLVDEQLNAAAFGALTIALGGTPDPVEESSTRTMVLVGLGVLVLVLAGGLGLGVWRLVGRRRATARRAWLAGAGWIVLGALSAVGVGVWLPGVAGLTLWHLLRFMPDIGQFAVVVVALGSALVVARLALLVVQLRGRRPG
jgi:CubicO group peptidase (beta-lactamase class C family)